MRDTELKRKKAEALYTTYKKGLEEGRFNSLFGAGIYCAIQPAPCFYISARQASLLIGRIESGDLLFGLSESQRRQIGQLWHNYRAYLREHPSCALPREQILEILVDEPAPEFYISAEGVRKILRAEIKKSRRKYGWGG